MLSVSQLCKSYDVRPILVDVNFTLNPGERLGLVGPNGCGKTTLLRILAGLEQPDRGSVRFDQAAVRVGYLPQGFQPPAGQTLAGFLEQMQGGAQALTERLEALAYALADAPDSAALQDEYDAVLARLSAVMEDQGRAPAVLAALGLAHHPPDLPVSALSGGEKTRLSLAGVLLARPQLLLLDEPTNHLDLEMLTWLENWLHDFRGAVLVVSHDRAFLDEVATSILALDGLTHTLRAYPGNYSDYAAACQAERERQHQSWQDQQDEIARLRASAGRLRGLANFRRGGKADTGDKFARGFFANRSLGTLSRAQSIEARIEHLLTDERVEKPALTWQMKMDFGPTPETGRDLFWTRDLAVGYGEKVLLANLNLHLVAGARTVIVGRNGCGKTTLLRTIAGRLPALAGELHLSSSARLGYMAQEQEELNPAFNPLETIRRAASFSETDARAFLSMYLFKGDDVFTPVGRLSYGERARLTLALMVAGGCNLLLLDEPLNHLDIPARDRFEQALANFPGTVLAVAHDRYFIDRFASDLWQFGVD